MSGSKWRCTGLIEDRDAIVAIKLDRKEVDWYFGPTYPVSGIVLDEDDLPACAINREDSNG